MAQDRKPPDQRLQAGAPKGLIEAIDLTEDVTEGGDNPGSVSVLYFV